MKRRLEFGCLMILTILAFLVLGALMRAQGLLPICRYQQNDIDTLDFGTFQTVYKPALRVPVSADWLLYPGDIGKAQREPSWRFAEDIRVPSPRATHDDYTHSGYDRGHLVPAADRSASISSMRSTFTMTNVCPQVPSLNRGEWKRLENVCRGYVQKGYSLRIHVDAVFWYADTQRIGAHAVAVPHAFVKTVYSWPSDSLLYSRYFQNY